MTIKSENSTIYSRKQQPSFLVVSGSFRWFGTSTTRNERAIMFSTPSNQKENGNKDSSLTHLPLSNNNNNNIFNKEMNLNNNQNVLQKRNNTKRLLQTKKESSSYCCCGSIKLEYFVIGITIVELIFYGYQLITYLFEIFFPPVTSNNNIETIPTLNFVLEESPSFELIGIFFILFSIVATVLLPVAWYTRSCHLIIPHLIMQFTLLTATLIIMCYLMAWIFGGIDLQISAIFFEHSPLGEEGVRNVSQRSPIEAHFTISHMQMGLAIILFFLAVVFLIQLWFFHLILRVFRYIRDNNNLDKFSSRNNSFVKAENGDSDKVDKNQQNLSPPRIQNSSSPSVKTCANISSPQLPNTSTTSTTATFSINSSPPPIILPEPIRIHQPTIQMIGDQRQPYNSFSSPTIYYEVHQTSQPQMRKELHV